MNKDGEETVTVQFIIGDQEVQRVNQERKQNESGGTGTGRRRGGDASPGYGDDDRGHGGSVKTIKIDKAKITVKSKVLTSLLHSMLPLFRSSDLPSLAFFILFLSHSSLTPLSLSLARWLAGWLAGWRCM